MRNLAFRKVDTSVTLSNRLFGDFKQFIERDSQAGINRTTLLVPALCGNLDVRAIT